MELDKIYLGDAYELIKQITDKSIDCIITDPPYEFSIKPKDWFKSCNKNGNMKDGIQLKEQIAEDDLTSGIREEMLDEWCRVLKKINIFVFCNKWQLLPYMKYFIDKKHCSFELLVWAKTNPVPLANGSYMHDKELCLNFWEKGTKRVGIHDIKHEKTVYSLPLNQKDKKEFKHPTIKPLEMVKNFVEIGTAEGGVILDCFMGSGTTAVACKEAKRRFIGFEKSVKWLNVANDRLEGLSVRDQEPIQGYVQERLL